MSRIAFQWRDALVGVIVRHPNHYSKPKIEIGMAGGHPHIHFSVDRIKDTLDQTQDMRSPFKIASVRLDIFPGKALARAWVAAAWFGYVGHETLELVTVDDLETKVLDPHAEPYEINPFNRSLRDGMPPVLDEASLRRTLLLVADEAHVNEMMAGLLESK